MKQKLVALFLIIVMVTSTLTAIAATTATPVAATSATTAYLSVTKTNPVIGQSVTFTAQLLKWNGASWVIVPSESTPQLKIIHYVNGVAVTDVAKTTDSKGKITWVKSWSSAGSTTYYAYFAGNLKYAASKSAGVTVTVRKNPTMTTLTVSKTNPVIGQSVTFTAQLLKWNGASWVIVPSESTPQLKIIHYVNGVAVTDVAKTTDSKGKITWVKSWSSAGSTTYYAYFAGNLKYAASKCADKTVTVQKIPTKLTITVYGGSVIANVLGMLTEQNGHALGKPETLQIYWGLSSTSLRWYGNTTTDATGNYWTDVSQVEHTTYVQVRFMGDSTYAASTSIIASVPPES